MLRLAIIIGFCTLCLIPIAGFASNVIENEALLIAFVFGFGYVALPAMLLHLWPARTMDTMERALAAGNLVTTQYSAVKLVELDDAGEYAFLAELADGRTLALGPDSLVDLVANGRFPTLQFRTFTHRRSTALYGLEPIGEPLQSWPVYGQFSEVLHGSVDGQIYDAPLDRLLARLGGREVRVAHRTGQV